MYSTSRFYVDGFLLNVYDSAYLVTVRPADGETGRYEDLLNLPRWIFQSPHAIWMTDEDSSFFVRAMHGEDVKKHLMSKFAHRL